MLSEKEKKRNKRKKNRAKEEGEKEIEKRLKNCEKEKAEYLAGWQRSKADFLNYKKEELKRTQEFLKYATENLLLKILPILDDFKKAEKELPEKLENDNYIKGILNIKKHLESFLRDQGIEKIEALNKEFDPRFHEAVEQIKACDKKSGIIVEEILAGYIIKNKLLRPAKVKVVK